MLEWNEIQPVLELVYDLIDQSPDGTTTGAPVAERLGLDSEDLMLRKQLWSLRDAGYIDARFAGGMGPAVMIQPTERGLQATRGWPKPGETPDVSVLLSVLDERISDPGTPEEERSRLKKLRSTASEVGSSVLGQVLAAYIKHTAGI